MKRIYLIGGTMGVGKTTTCQILKQKLPNAVFLDGDWCWDANPLAVTEETKAMVMDNICHTLGNFIHCSAISLYDSLDTVKVDVSDIAPKEAAERIIELK